MKEFKHKQTPKEIATEKDIEDRERRKAITAGDFEVVETPKTTNN